MKRFGHALAGVVCVAALLLMACGDDGTDPFVAADGGTTMDSAAFDAGVVGDDQGILAPDPTVTAAENPSRFDSPGFCASSADDDGVPIGCQDPSCGQSARTCCTGRADCCEAAIADTTDFDCEEGACFPDATASGSPTPEFDSGFFPRGDGSYDSGLVLAKTYDLRVDRVALQFTMAPPTAACGLPYCLRTVAVGLVAAPPQGMQDYVRPLAALVWANDRILLVVGDRVASEWVSVEGGDWTLRSSPDGSVEVGHDGWMERFDQLLEPTSTARVVLYGHNENPGADEVGAHLTSLSVAAGACETTRQWGERSTVIEAVDTTSQELIARSPSAARDADGTLRVVYLDEEGRLVATQRTDDNTPATLVLVNSDDPVIDGDADDSVLAPELVAEGDGFALFFERDGKIIRTASTGTRPLTFGGQVEVAGLIGELETAHAPSVVTRGADPIAAMVARIDAGDGSRARIGAFALDGTNAEHYSWLPTGQLGSRVGDPEIFIRNGLYQVYVPYLRGARWRMAHIVSEDFVHWNVADDAAMLREGDEERMGPRAPDVVQLDATETFGGGIEVFYERFDGLTHRVGHVVRRTPESATVRD